jgi:hypothetical protein
MNKRVKKLYYVSKVTGQVRMLKYADRIKHRKHRYTDLLEEYDDQSSSEL